MAKACESERERCNAKVHTQGMKIVKRTNEHLHTPDEQVVSSYETKVGIKRKARETQDSSHHIVGESLETVSRPNDPQAIHHFISCSVVNSILPSY